MSPVAKQRRGGRRLLQQLTTVLTGGVVRSTCGVLQGFIIAKYLGAGSFGEYAYAMAIVAVVFGLADFRIAEAVIKFTSALRAERKLFETYAASAVFIAFEFAKGAVGFAIVLLVGLILHDLNGAESKVSYELVVLIGLFQLSITLNPTLTAWLRLGERFNAIAYYDVFFGIFLLVVTGGAAILKGDVKSVAIAYAAAGLVGGLAKLMMVIVFFRRHVGSFLLNWKPVLDSSKRLPWRHMWRFLIGINLSSTVRVAARQIDVLILGTFVPLEVVGGYSLAKKLKNVFAYITDPLLTVIYPEFARQFAEKNYLALERLYKRVTASALISAVVLAIGAGLSAPLLLPMIFGSDYGNSTQLFQIFLIDAIITTGFFSSGAMALVLMRPRLLVFGALMHLTTIVVLGVPLSRFFDAIGMTIAVVVAVMISQIYVYQSGKTRLGSYVRSDSGNAQEKKL